MPRYAGSAEAGPRAAVPHFVGPNFRARARTAALTARPLFMAPRAGRVRARVREFSRLFRGTPFAGRALPTVGNRRRGDFFPGGGKFGNSRGIVREAGKRGVVVAPGSGGSSYASQFVFPAGRRFRRIARQSRFQKYRSNGRARNRRVLH